MSDLELDGDQFEDDDDDDAADDVDGNRIPAGHALAVCEFVVRSLVDDPDAVRVEVNDRRGRRTGLDVHVAPGDMGRVIGKRGRTANAVRTVVRAAAVRDGIEVEVEFVD